MFCGELGDEYIICVGIFLGDGEWNWGGLGVFKVELGGHFRRMMKIFCGFQ